jgi:hypothetical protein
MSLEWKVGNKYVDREGNVYMLVLIDKELHNPLVFKTHDSNLGRLVLTARDRNGKCKNSDIDIIAEYKPLIEMGKRYKTRDGREVILYTVNGADSEKPVIGEICSQYSVVLFRWSDTGFCSFDEKLSLVEVL